MPAEKEVCMKMVMAVLLVRMIISLFNQNETTAAAKTTNSNRVKHPAEFEIR